MFKNKTELLGLTLKLSANMEKHLRSEQYYIDQYDRATVDLMRIKEKYFLHSDSKVTGNKKVKEFKRATNGLLKDLALYFETGERYLEKRETIRKWMDEDRKRDELMESAKPPVGIFCLACDKEMVVETSVLHTGNLNTEDKVLFIFRCDSCHKGRGFFHTGEEYKTKPELCDKCGSVLNKTHKREEERITTYYHCPEHDLVKTYEYDMKSQPEQVDPSYEADRDRFCISAEAGQEYLSFKINTENLQQVIKKIEDREAHKEQYDKVASIKKLSIVELDNLLASKLEEQGYIKLELKTPEQGRHVIVPFSIRDARPGREEYGSKKQLGKIIKRTLETTNWRLMSTGINYRLGMLFGELRGYEKEEDLFKLECGKHEKKALDKDLKKNLTSL